MQAQTDLRQQAHSVFAAQGYVDAVHVQAEASVKSADPRPVLEVLGRNITDVVEKGRPIMVFLDRLIASTIVSDQLHGILISLLDCVDGLRQLMSRREGLIDSCHLAEEYWTDSLQGEMAAQLEHLEESYDALALRRAPLAQLEQDLCAYISAVAGTEMDLDRELEAASVEHILASDPDSK